MYKIYLFSGEYFALSVLHCGCIDECDMFTVHCGFVGWSCLPPPAVKKRHQGNYAG